MIGVPKKAIKKFTKPSHREIVVGHLLAYGLFPQTTEGIDKAKKFVEGLNEWVAPSDLPNYYDDIDSDLMTGRETAGIRNIKMILEDFYFGDRNTEQPEPEPEKEPEVTLIVNEVENKTNEEPIQVEVNVPSVEVSSPQVKKKRIIRARSIKNTIKKRRTVNKTKDLVGRMTRAFDKRLEELVDNIQNPPPSPPIKIKKPKKLKQVSVKKYNFKPQTSKKSASNFNEFILNKVGSAFSLAAQARKYAKESGAPQQKRGFFLKKALRHEFGGDFINRTAGTFSNNPTKTQDPALSRGQRFSASLSPFLNPPSSPTSVSPSPQYTQPSLFDTNKTGVVKVDDLSLKELLRNRLNKLQKSYDSLNNSVSSISSSNDSESESNKNSNKLLVALQNSFDGINKSLKKSNQLDKDENKTKQLSLDLYKDSIEKQQMDAEAASIASTRDSSGTVGYKKANYASEGILGPLKRFLFGDEEDCDCDDEDNNGGIDIDRRRRRRPGTKRRWMRKQGNRFKKWASGQVDRLKGFATRNIDKGKNLFQRGIQTGKGLADKGRQAVSKGKQLVKGGIEAGKGLVGKGLQTAKGLFSSGKNAVSAGIQGTKNWWDNVGTGIAKRFAFAGAKNAGKYAPGVLSTAAYAADTTDRLKRGDKFGAWLNAIGYGSDVAATGLAAASAGPQAPATGSGAGIASIISATADSINFVRDVFTGPTENKPKKMAEGGTNVMTGEAGPEMWMPQSKALGSSSVSESNLFPSAGLILGTTSKILRSAGPVASGARSYIEQQIGPLAKIFGRPQYNLTTQVGKGISAVQEPKMDSEDGLFGLLKKIIKFVLGQEDVDDKKTPVVPPPMGQGTDFWTLAAIASMEASDPQHQADVAQSVYNRLADGRFGSSIVDILTRENQYEPAFNAPGVGNGINPLFKSITDIESAARAVQDGSKRIFNRDITLDQAREQVQKAAQAIQDPSLQQKAAQFVGPYTDFRGYETTGAVRRPDGGNYFFSENPSGKLSGAAPIPVMGSASPPGTPPGGPGGAPTPPTRAVGDSLAEGASMATGGRIKDNATQSLNPTSVNQSLRSAGINRGNTGNVLLSTGLANDPTQRDQAIQQMQYLRSQGIPFTVMPLPTQLNEKYLKEKGLNTNAWLQSVVPQQGGTMAPSFSGGSDGVHATPQEYLRMLNLARLAQ